jgi:hypothetical protein
VQKLRGKFATELAASGNSVKASGGRRGPARYFADPTFAQDVLERIVRRWILKGRPCSYDKVAGLKRENATLKKSLAYMVRQLLGGHGVADDDEDEEGEEGELE